MNTVKTQSKKSTKKSVLNESFRELPSIEKVIFLSTYIEFHLTDGRIITIPLMWVSKLNNATKTQRENYIIRGHFVFWDEIDEIIGAKNLLNGSIVPTFK